MKNIKYILVLLITFLFLSFVGNADAQTTRTFRSLIFNEIAADSVKSGEIDTSDVYILDYNFSKIYSHVIIDSLSASDSLCIRAEVSLNKSDWYIYSTSGSFENTDTLTSETNAVDILLSVPRYIRWIYTPKGTGVYVYYRHYAIIKQY